jgi:hypothetical protein
LLAPVIGGPKRDGRYGQSIQADDFRP